MNNEILKPGTLVEISDTVNYDFGNIRDGKLPLKPYKDEIAGRLMAVVEYSTIDNNYLVMGRTYPFAEYWVIATRVIKSK